MEVHNVDSTVEESHSSIKERDVHLSYTQSVTRDKIKTTHQTGQFSVVAEVFIALAITFVGLGVFKVTGLYNGMESTVGKVVLGSLITGYCWVMFRHGFYSRQFH